MITNRRPRPLRPRPLHTPTRSFSQAWSFVLLSAIIVTSVHSHLLHPYDQAVGLWNLSLCRRDRALLESMVFPPLPLNGETTLDSVALDVDQTNAAATEEQEGVSSKIEVRRQRRQKRLECELRLNSDGTFVLSPPPSLDRRGIDNNVGKRVPLEGCWKLRQNPYCVTDRHYDQLSLVSHPKVRLHSSVGQGREVDSEAKETSQHVSGRDTVTLEMRCKVWGRYGSNTIRRLLNYPLGRDASRMTHGTLSAKFSQPDVNKNRVRRVVCATFQAKTCSIVDNERDTEDEDDEFWEYD